MDQYKINIKKGKITLLVHKLDGGALYFAIFIILVLSLISSGFILLNQLWFHENTVFIRHTQLNDNLDAAEILIKTRPDLAIPGESKEIDIFNDGIKVRIRTERWGLLRLVRLSTSWRSLTIERTALYSGITYRRCALYLTDSNKFLSLVGKCSINGDCFLPKLGIRAGEIDGVTLHGQNWIDGQISMSQNELPRVPPESVKQLSGYWYKKFNLTDSIINIDDLNRNPVSSESFSSGTNVINCGKNVRLENISLSGNIIVTASDTITVFPSAHLEDIVLFARTILISDNVTGTFQLFARGSIIIGDNCLMKYPSFAVCYSESLPVSITIGKNTSIRGGVLMYSSCDGPNSSFLKMGEDDVLTGLIYVYGKVGFAGKIEGSLYCNSFFIDTPRGYYENLVKDIVIDCRTFPAKRGSFVINDRPDKLKMVKQCLQL